MKDTNFDDISKWIYQIRCKNSVCSQGSNGVWVILHLHLSLDLDIYRPIGILTG